ncbi:MAG TPA: YIP1 family protein [Planctomycetota bacterium]|nr:YIP1 family protein [Planctomycetota bacterium]
MGDAAAVSVPPDKVYTVPPIGRRILGILLDPIETFRALDASWGILGPWLAIAAAGLLYSVIFTARVDATAIMKVRLDYQNSLLPDQVRRQAAQVEESMHMDKFGALMAAAGNYGGAVLGSILRIVIVGVIIFWAAWFFGGRGGILKAIVVSAHAKLVMIASYAVLSLALLLGNPLPDTSLKNVADEVKSPLQAAFLDIFDPMAMWHTALVACGLVVALQVRRGRAILVALALHLFPWLCMLGMAALSGMNRS